jgi:hypothetical protein
MFVCEYCKFPIKHTEFGFSTGDGKVWHNDCLVKQLFGEVKDELREDERPATLREK